MKTNIIYRIVPVVVSAFAALSASGQNLDPTVEVSRAYEGKLMEVHKPQIKMAVPDSVLRFDLEFDYSVAESPYKGAYEFSPYTLNMKPSPTYRDINTFYVKAGAGYQLHPVFDAVWSPLVKGPFRMSAYASHRSFVGNYWKMSDPASVNDAVLLDRDRPADKSKYYWPGYDLRSTGGIEGRYDWAGGLLGFDAAYKGLHQRDKRDHVIGRSYNALDAHVFVESKNHRSDRFRYHADASYRLAGDVISNTAAAGDKRLKENDFSLSGGLGYMLQNGDVISVGLGFDMALLDGSLYCAGGDFDLAPHYVMDRDRWHLDLGFRLSSSFRSDSVSEMYGYEEQMIYPDINIEYRAVPAAMKLFLRIGGDSKVNSYADVLSHNHRATADYGRDLWNILDITDERISVSAGAEGRIGNRLSYGFKGGYVNYGNAMLEGVVMQSAVKASPARWLPAIGYTSYDQIFASVDLLLDMEHFRFDGNVKYAYSRFGYYESDRGLLLPASLTGDVSAEYDWKQRVIVGVDCRFSSARTGTAFYAVNQYTFKPVDAKVPGYADLGVEAEYVVNRKFSAWARGGNLLGMTIQNSLLYAEKGPYFTLGICLNL